jgi:hypothetical protein
MCPAETRAFAWRVSAKTNLFQIDAIATYLSLHIHPIGPSWGQNRRIVVVNTSASALSDVRGFALGKADF